MEAYEYKRLFGDSTHLILVTSASHMPRSVSIFKRAGLSPVPAPANHLVKKPEVKPLLWWFPSSKNIEKSESAIHEYVGMLWYRLEDNLQD
jgi:uncharacterized SAM-binding protein YcdF (DUF218 family)